MSRCLSKLIKDVKSTWQLYLLILLPMIYLILFKYYPMAGIQIAFKDYNVVDGIWGSAWVGLKHFKRFIQSYYFGRLMLNTIILSVYQLLASFPLPIILALSLNYVNNKKLKKTVQTVTYIPHFLSVVVIIGMVMQFFGPRTGLVNMFLQALGLESVDFLGNPSTFRHLYVWSGIWQSVGYSSIIYIAALASIPEELHEAAVVDGANKLQRIRHVDIPGIMPTAIVILIMNTGRMLDIGFEKVLLMQNPMNTQTAEIISSYVYNIGLASAMPDFSYPAAIGLFQSIISLTLLVAVNKFAKYVSETSLW